MIFPKSLKNLVQRRIWKNWTYHKCDKTNKIVIMYSQDYDKKMNELLIDKKTYTEIKTDLTKQYQKKNNE